MWNKIIQHLLNRLSSYVIINAVIRDKNDYILNLYVGHILACLFIPFELRVFLNGIFPYKAMFVVCFGTQIRYKTFSASHIFIAAYHRTPPGAFLVNIVYLSLSQIMP